MLTFHGASRGWRPGALLVAAAIAFPLAGCTAGTPAAMPSPTSTMPATPAAAADSVPTAPAQVFDGDCDAVLTSAEAGVALGTPMSATTPGAPKVTPEDFGVGQAGGLECGWGPRSAGTGAELGIVVLPATFMEPTDNTVPYCYGADSGTLGTGSCSFNVSSSGFWLSGVAYTPAGTTNDDARRAITKLSEQFALNAGAAPAFVPTPTAADVWTDKIRAGCLAQLTPEEIRSGEVHTCACTAVATSTPVAAVLADTGITAGPGNGRGETPHGYYRALRAPGNIGCLWADASAGGNGFGTETLAGAAWVQMQLAATPGIRELTIEGVDRSLLSGDGRSLDVFDGPNWLHLSLTSTWGLESYGPFATALVAALNDAR